MTVSVTGSLRVEAYANIDVADPQGALLGTARVAGDASGGFADITYNLPNQFMYVLQMFGADVGHTTDTTFEFQIITGVVIDAVGEQYAELIRITGAPSNSMALMDPNKFLWLPEEASNPRLAVRITNPGAGVNFSSSCRLLFWPHDIIRGVPVRLISAFL